MRCLYYLSFLCLFFASYQARTASDYSISHEQKLVSICTAVKKNKVHKLRQATRSANLTYTKVAEGVLCNGQRVVDFAVANDAFKAANYLIDKSTRGYVEIIDIANTDE